jgi:polar amino acid transport system substrate-binding protein
VPKPCWSWLGIAAALALGVGVNRACAEERVDKDERALTFGADVAGGEPYVFHDPSDPTRIRGFESELRFLLAQEINRPILFKQYSFDNLVQGLQRGDFDFILNGFENLPERRREVRFTRPYYVYRLQLVVPEGETRFQSLEDFKRHKKAIVGTLSGSAAETYLDDNGYNYRPYDGQDQIYQDLLTGRIQGAYLDTLIHKTYLAKPEFRGLKMVGEPSEKGYYAIAVRKKDEALWKDLNKALGNLIDSGELKRLYEKPEWNMWNEDQEELKNPPEFPEEDGPAESSTWTLSRYLPLLLRGAWMTVKISALSMMLAVALGLVIATSRMYGPAPVRALAITYIEFFRGIPVLILLVFLYFALPPMFKSMGLEGWGKLDAFTAAVLGLGINYAAYEAEIYRAGISSVSAGQWEAAASLGMPSRLTFRRIILPQAIRFILPPMTGDFIALFKDTSIVSIIGVVELSHEYQTVSKESLKYLEIGLVTAALYLIMSVPLGYLSRYLEKRWCEGQV